MTMYYSLTERVFFDDALHATVPDDAVQIDVADYRALLQQQAQGMVIDWSGPAPVCVAPPPIAPRVPVVISRFQARAALLQSGQLEAVEVFMASASPLAQLAWAEATELRRDSVMLVALSLALGMSADGVDDLFRAAAAISV